MSLKKSIFINIPTRFIVLLRNFLQPLTNSNFPQLPHFDQVSFLFPAVAVTSENLRENLIKCDLE